MSLTVLAIIAVALVLLVAFASGYGASRWQSGSAALGARLESLRVAPSPARYDPREIEPLPEPVKRYFRAVLQPGQPIISAARIAHEGQFNLSEERPRWVPFVSTQRVIAHRPGFDWDARIRMAPGIAVFVHDAYVAGQGLLLAQVMGLLTVARLRGTREIAESELMRFLAEAVWYPTRLLPSQGVAWEAIDDASARATLADGVTRVSLDFAFGEDGLVSSVGAKARHRAVRGMAVPTPWQCRVWDYQIRDGMRVPLQGEVSWVLPDGAKPYWRGRASSVAYELAGDES